MLFCSRVWSAYLQFQVGWIVTRFLALLCDALLMLVWTFSELGDGLHGDGGDGRGKMTTSTIVTPCVGVLMISRKLVGIG